MYLVSTIWFLLSAGSIMCELCSDDETVRIQTKLQSCSHSTATSFYQTIQDLTSVKIISDKLCKAFNRIGTVCVKHLNECFAADDAMELSALHLEEIKEFLLTIVLGKAPKNTLDNCRVAVDENIDDIKDDNYSIQEVENETETYDERVTKYIPDVITATDDNMIRSTTESGGYATELVDEDIAASLTTVEKLAIGSTQRTPSIVTYKHVETEDKTSEYIPGVNVTNDINDPDKVKDYLEADIKNENKTEENSVDEFKKNADEALIDVTKEETAARSQNITENKTKKSYASAMITVEYHSGACVIHLRYLTFIWFTLMTLDREF